MQKTTLLLMLIGLMSSQLQALEPLSDVDLQSVEGQAGADLSLKLILNQNILTDAELLNGTAPKFDNCGTGNLEFCRLAISPNKRFMNGAIPSDTAGNRLWLVFKGIQGTMNIQKLSLDGADLIYTNDSSQPTIKPAIQLGFDANMPIQIRNYGFSALSIEKDSFISTQSDPNILAEPANQTGFGYLNKGSYTATASKTGTVGSGATTANNYDTGREKGFMGLQMNGNMVLQGKIMMFSCDTSHPRC